MKEYRVTISDETLAGTEKYLRYIADAQGAPLTAIRWWNKAVEQIFSLSHMPNRCPYAPENDFHEFNSSRAAC